MMLLDVISHENQSQHYQHHMDAVVVFVIDGQPKQRRPKPPKHGFPNPRPLGLGLQQLGGVA